VITQKEQEKRWECSKGEGSYEEEDWVDMSSSKDQTEQDREQDEADVVHVPLRSSDTGRAKAGQGGEVKGEWTGVPEQRQRSPSK
jgi:hypothetical protein